MEKSSDFNQVFLPFIGIKSADTVILLYGDEFITSIIRQVNYKNSKTQTKLLDRVVEEFERGAKLVNGLSDEVYLKTNTGVGSIGAHIRHNLDFASNFLRGLEKEKINYNLRERDIKIERDRQYAVEQFHLLIQKLKNLTDEILHRKVVVCSEIDTSNWHDSSAGRELEFLHSHTVHHYALITEKLNSSGIEVSSDFGVAPSTLEFWASRKTKSRVA